MKYLVTKVVYETKTVEADNIEDALEGFDDVLEVNDRVIVQETVCDYDDNLLFNYFH